MRTSIADSSNNTISPVADVAARVGDTYGLVAAADALAETIGNLHLTEEDRAKLHTATFGYLAAVANAATAIKLAAMLPERGES